MTTGRRRTPYTCACPQQKTAWSTPHARKTASRPGPHHAGRAVPGRADPFRLLDPAALHRRNDLGHDAGGLHMAGDEVVRGTPLAPAQPGGDGDDPAVAAAVLRAAHAGHRHHRQPFGRDHRSRQGLHQFPGAVSAGMGGAPALRRGKDCQGLGRRDRRRRLGAGDPAHALRRQRREMAGVPGREHRHAAVPVPADRHHLGADVRRRRGSRRCGAPLRPPAGRDQR